MVGSVRSILACSLSGLRLTAVLGCLAGGLLGCLAGCGQRGPLRLAPAPAAPANSEPAGLSNSAVLPATRSAPQTTDRRAPDAVAPENIQTTPLRLEPSLQSGPNRP